MHDDIRVDVYHAGTHWQLTVIDIRSGLVWTAAGDGRKSLESERARLIGLAETARAALGPDAPPIAWES